MFCFAILSVLKANPPLYFFFLLYLDFFCSVWYPLVTGGYFNFNFKKSNIKFPITLNIFQGLKSHLWLVPYWVKSTDLERFNHCRELYSRALI